MQRSAWYLLASVGLLAACAKPAPSPTSVTPSPTTPAEPAPAVTSPPAGTPAAAVPEAFVVSTNEPFWHASASGGKLVLTGPAGERTLVLESNEAVADGRHALARDGQGTLEVKIIAKPCQDDMSGADFPYTGSLSFDGATEVDGCARGASDPVPKPK